MFPPRRASSIVALGGIVVALFVVPWPEPWRTIGPLAAVLALTTAGLVGEILGLARAGRIAVPTRLPRDGRPADGVVGIAPMAGVRGEPNPSDPRFRRFVAASSLASPSIDDVPETRAIPPLLGRVVVISVFIGRDRQPWSEPEIARAHDAMLRAVAWIEREAIRWEAAVNLDLAETYFVADDGQSEDVEVAFSPVGEMMQPFEPDAATKALAGASRAATQLGFRDAVALIAGVNPRVRADARVWLLHPRQAGHSMAIPLDVTELAGVSLAVCYASEANFPGPLPLSRPPFTDPVTVVHELLHLFGASDKYGVSLRSFPDRSVTHREIMRLDESSLSRSRIDPLTAREIGWIPD